MSKDNQIAVRFNDRTYEAIQEFAEEYDLTNAEALRRITEGRLSGEGYLSGPTLADGGVIEERFEDIEKQTQSIASNQRLTTKIHGWIALSLVWIGFVLSLSPPSVWTAATGLVLLLGFAVNWAKEYLAGKE